MFFLFFVFFVAAFFHGLALRAVQRGTSRFLAIDWCHTACNEPLDESGQAKRPRRSKPELNYGSLEHPATGDARTT